MDHIMLKSESNVLVTFSMDGTDSVAKRENVPPTIDTPKNCLPFYKNQTPLHKLIIASYQAVPRYPLFATLPSDLNNPNDLNGPNDLNELNDLNDLNDWMTESFAVDWQYGLFGLVYHIYLSKRPKTSNS